MAQSFPFNVNVVDERLAAGRGHEYTAAYQREKQEELIELARLEDGDFRLARWAAGLRHLWC